MAERKKVSDCLSKVRQTRHVGHCWRSRDELISDVLLWAPTYGQAKAGRPAWTYIQQLCEDMGCSPEYLPEAMNDREKWQERVRGIRTSGTTWWWWWLNILTEYLVTGNARMTKRKKVSDGLSKVRRTRHAGHCWRSRDELISDVPLWTPAYGQAKAGRPARTYIQQLCEDIGCSPEDMMIMMTKYFDRISCDWQCPNNWKKKVSDCLSKPQSHNYHRCPSNSKKMLSRDAVSG